MDQAISMPSQEKRYNGKLLPACRLF